jgi:hypothetical protein
MTPKQKAKQLVELFTFSCRECDYETKAKQCALIAVDIVLDEIQPFELGYEYEAKIKFWNNVKQEIEAL